MRQIRMGAMQLRIMKVLWQRKQASAREISAELNREKPVAHSTVQTLLRKLEKKGALVHEVQDRTFVFRASVDQQSVKRRAARDLIDRAFDGNAAGLVAYLLREERISSAEISQLRNLIESKSKEGGKHGSP